MPKLSQLSPLLSLIALAASIAALALVVVDTRSRLRLVEGSGSRVELSPRIETRVGTRVQFPVQTVEDSDFRNHMISLSHNWQWDPEHGWQRPQRGEPSVALTLESYFRGLAELNLDVGAPGIEPPWKGGRAMGFAARLDGSYTTLSIGGEMFHPDGAGVKLTGGSTAEPVLLVNEGPRLHQPLLEARRDDGVASVRLSGGALPRLALAGEDGGVALGGDGRMEWQDRDGRSVAAMSPAASGLRILGTTTINALRVGEAGTPLAALRLRHIEVAPEILPPGSVQEMRVRVDGATSDSIVFVNGPAQPAGVTLAGARPSGTDEIALTFVNLAATARRPAAGRYLLLEMQSEPQ